MKETIEVYQGLIVAIHVEEFQADLYRADDIRTPFAFGTFYNRIIAAEEMAQFLVGNTFTFEIYREDGDIKWAIKLHEGSNGSGIKINSKQPC